MNPLNPGLQVDDLQVQAVLSRGTDRLHYRVADTALGKTFVLVEYAPEEGVARRDTRGRLSPAPGADEAFAAGRARFLAEARLAGKLEHPALPRVLRLIEANGTVYQLRPDVEGEPLAKQLGEPPPPAADTVRDAFLELADGLAELHGADAVHGRLTPDQVLIDAKGRAHVLDLDPPDAGDASMAASPWRAPEQLDDGDADARSDIYALAALLSAWLTGTAPPAAARRLAAREAQQPDPLDPDTLRGLGGLGDALARGLRLNPDDRPASMTDWRDALDRIDWRLRMAGEAAAGNAAPEGRPWLPVALAVVVTLVMAAGAVFLLTDRDLPVDQWLEDVDVGAERDRGPRVAPPTSEEQARWEAALEADTLLGYRTFLADFPTSVYTEQAQVQIDIIDERRWTELSAEDTRSAYVDYLDLFPTGLHQAEALRRIEAMDRETARLEREKRERERRDNEAWEAARQERSIASMEAYIEAWPAGLHIEEAQRTLRDLRDRANDDEAFTDARTLGTRDAMQAYLDAFPRGAHVAEALELLERYTLSPGKPFRDCAVCPELRVMPVGAFAQGAADDDPLALEQEKPRRVVTFSRPFAVGIFEVTFGQWDACVADGGCETRPPDNGWGRGDRPVINVSWNDAQAYVAWLSEKTGETYRLPTESEWEYVARADSRGPWLGDDPAAVCRFGNVAGAETGFDWQHEACEDNYPVGTVPVGAFSPNKAGLFDVIGNVAEWTADCLNLSYLDAPTDGSAWTRGLCSSHMTRGGSWVTGSRDIRLSSRFNLKNGDRNDFTGFRVVRDIDE